MKKLSDIVKNDSVKIHCLITGKSEERKVIRTTKTQIVTIKKYSNGNESEHKHNKNNSHHVGYDDHTMIISNTEYPTLKTFKHVHNNTNHSINDLNSVIPEFNNTATELSEAGIFEEVETVELEDNQIIESGYMAIDIDVKRDNQIIESYTLSLGIEHNKHVQNIIELLPLYTSGKLHTIEQIKVVQTFLLCSGYGLSNCIILKTSNVYIKKD